MQVLLVRLMYSKTRKTSLKALDTYIADAEAYVDPYNILFTFDSKFVS